MPFTKALFLLGDSNMFSPCSPATNSKTVHNGQKERPHVLGTRDTRGGGGAAAAAAEGKSAQIALATERFLDSRTGLALLICRARATSHARHVTHDTSRTTRHARHARHGARGSVLVSRLGIPAVSHPQPPTQFGRPCRDSEP